LTQELDRDKALNAAIFAAKGAGGIALSFFGKSPAVTIKRDNSPVTIADLEAEKFITESLTKEFPDCGFLCEETGEHEPSKKRRWIIDPIDGTKNFIRGIPVWSVLVALEEKSEVTVGVIHNPVTNDTWTAAKNLGARHNGQPISVSRRSLEKGLLLHGGISILKKSPYWNGFLGLVDATERQRGFGDVLGYTMVAEGKAEIYLDFWLKPWDLAAPSIVVREAGGIYTDLRGNATIYGGNALVTNSKEMHTKVLEILNARPT